MPKKSAFDTSKIKQIDTYPEYGMNNIYLFHMLKDYTKIMTEGKI